MDRLSKFLKGFALMGTDALEIIVNCFTFSLS